MNRFVIGIEDQSYPQQLKDTPDPPARIWGIGDPTALRPALAIIGARRATPYGLSATELFSGWASESGYVVVSGGAHGCDQAAHRAALDAGGSTVAVMAGGPDVIYPSSAGALHARIVASGAVISEHPWGTRPQRWMFRKRNRIIAGLAAAVLVVEAGLPSGTFSTADDALAAGRDVLAVPGSIMSPESRGSNRLIAQGAGVITDVSDLAAALRSVLGEPLSLSLWDCLLHSTDDDELLRALTAQAMRPDDAAFALGLDVVAVMRRLGTLESAGQVVRYRDGRYGPGRRA